MPDSCAIDPAKLRVTVGALTDRLAQRDYEGAILLALGSRIGWSELERTVQDYDQHLVPLPALAFEVAFVASVPNTRPQQWSVLVPLWTQEGRSDLYLELTLEDSSELAYRVEIDDLHVL